MIQNNPFYIFDIPMNASKSMLAAASEAALLKGERRADVCFSTLVNPVKRINAELGWFPGVSEESIAAIRKAVRASQPLDCTDLSGVARVNAQVYNFGLLTQRSGADQEDFPKRLAAKMLAIAKSYTEIDSEAVGASINREREQAEILPADSAALKEGLQFMKKEIGHDVDNALQTCGSEIYAEVYRCIGDAISGNPELYLNAVTNEFIDIYEIRMFEAIARHEQKIHELAVKIKGSSRKFGLESKYYKNKMLKELMEWIRLADPVLVRAYAEGTQPLEAYNLTRDLWDAAEFFCDMAYFDNHEKAGIDLIRKAGYILERNRYISEQFLDFAEEKDEEIKDAQRKLRQSPGYRALCFFMLFLFGSTALMMILSEAGLSDNTMGNLVLVWVILFYLILVVLIVWAKKKKKEQKEKENPQEKKKRVYVKK